MNFWAGFTIIVSMLIAAVVVNNFVEKDQMTACLKNNPIEACNEFLNQ